jgi:hypothetical protein
MKISLNFQHILYPHLYPHPHHRTLGHDGTPISVSPISLNQSGAYQRLLSTVIPPFLTVLLQATRGNKAHAARLAGFDRSTLARKLQHYQMGVEKRVCLLPSSLATAPSITTDTTAVSLHHKEIIT